MASAKIKDRKVSMMSVTTLREIATKKDDNKSRHKAVKELERRGVSVEKPEEVSIDA